MKGHSTRQAARKVGIALVTLQRWIASGKVKAPPVVLAGNKAVRLWSKRDVERLRKQLPTLYYKAGDGRRKRRKGKKRA